MKIKLIIRPTLLTSFISLFCFTLFGQKDLSESWERKLNLRQPQAKVFKAIGVKPGMTIGEIGAGRGRYTVYLATEISSGGVVFANDIDEASLSYLRGRCKALGINNVKTIVGEMNDPLFPDNTLDMALMVLVYHMIEKPDELLRNIKHSLKPGAQLYIVDPRDKFIDAEFGIDRSKPDVKTPTIRERVSKSAEVAGYDLIRIDTLLPDDYIFTLKPVVPFKKKPAGEIICKILLNNGIEAANKEFLRMKTDSATYDLSEKVFTNLGYEYIGSKTYPEAIAVLKMGIELYPKSAILHGEIGEAYVLIGEKENARNSFKLYIENSPGIPNGEEMLKSFDAMYESMRPKK